MEKTLTELISGAPNFRVKRQLNNHNSKQKSALSISSIVINSSILEVKKSKKDTIKEEEIGESEEENEVVVSGGYGTVKGVYSQAPTTNYINYDKLFSHLGSFRAKGMYEDFDENHINRINSRMLIQVQNRLKKI